MLLDLEELPREDLNYDMLGGLFMAKLERIPMVGDKFEWHDVHFEVIDIAGHRVDPVLIVPVKAPALYSGWYTSSFITGISTAFIKSSSVS